MPSENYTLEEYLQVTRSSIIYKDTEGIGKIKYKDNAFGAGRGAGLRRVQSIEEFDLLLANHRANGSFVKLDYGLIPPKSPQTGKEDNQTLAQIRNSKEASPKAGWFFPDCALLKTCITVGTFLNSD